LILLFRSPCLNLNLAFISVNTFSQLAGSKQHYDVTPGALKQQGFIEIIDARQTDIQ